MIILNSVLVHQLPLGEGDRIEHTIICLVSDRVNQSATPPRIERVKERTKKSENRGSETVKTKRERNRKREKSRERDRERERENERVERECEKRE